MVESDRDRFAVEIMAPLAEVFGEISALTIQAWWMALHEYPFEAIQRAALSCLRSFRSRIDDEGHQWRALWPTPGDVIAVMGHQAEAHEEQQAHRRALPAPAIRLEMANEAMAQINAALAGTLTVDALIAWCSEAEARWPGIGWAAASEYLRRHRPIPRRGLTRQERGGYAIILNEELAMLTPEQRAARERLLGMDGKPVTERVPF